MTHRLFTYGSLLFEDVFEAVTGARAHRDEAWLDHHARYRLRGETYPAIVYERGARTAGALYHGIDAAMLARLDRFEGDEYLRCTVTVGSAAGTFECQTYVLRDDERHRLLLEPWDVAAFERDHRPGFAAKHMPEEDGADR